MTLLITVLATLIPLLTYAAEENPTHPSDGVLRSNELLEEIGEGVRIQEFDATHDYPTAEWTRHNSHRYPISGNTLLGEIDSPNLPDAREAPSPSPIPPYQVKSEHPSLLTSEMILDELRPVTVTPHAQPNSTSNQAAVEPSAESFLQSHRPYAPPPPNSLHPNAIRARQAHGLADPLVTTSRQHLDEVDVISPFATKAERSTASSLYESAPTSLLPQLEPPQLPSVLHISGDPSSDTPGYARDLQLSPETALEVLTPSPPSFVTVEPMEPLDTPLDPNISPSTTEEILRSIDNDWVQESSPASLQPYATSGSAIQPDELLDELGEPTPIVFEWAEEGPATHPVTSPLPEEPVYVVEAPLQERKDEEDFLKEWAYSEEEWPLEQTEPEGIGEYRFDECADYALFMEEDEEYEELYPFDEDGCLAGPCDGDRFPAASAVCAALSCQRDIKIAQLGMAVTKGFFCQSAGPFDLFLEGSAEHISSLDTRDFGVATDLTSHNTLIRLLATKQFRCSGTRFRLGGDFDHNDFITIGDVEFRRAGASRVFFEVEQPLWRGRGCSLEAAREMGAFHDWQASKMAALQVISEQVQRVLQAYWDAVAARQFLQINIESEQRLERLVENTRKLIEADTLAAAEIDQPLARLARQRVRRTRSEQDLYSAVQALTVAVGYTDDRYIVNPTNCFLDELPSPDAWINSQSEAEEALIDFALCCRYDIQEAEFQVQRTNVLWKGACNEKQAQLDLIGGAAIIDEKYGSRVAGLDDILRYNQPQKDFTIGVRLSRPLYNMEACGRALRSRAEYEQAEFQLDNLRLNAIAEVRQLWGEHISLAIQAKQITDAVKHYRSLMTNEARKLTAGLSTLFELIDYEQQLTNTQQEQVDILRRYAQNIAALRHVSGTLIADDDNIACFYEHSATTIPTCDPMGYP